MGDRIMLFAAALLVSGCAFADIGSDEESGLDEIEFQADNGIFLDNGLNLANGMNLGNGTSLVNGMNLGNGIDLSNGMNLGNGIVAPPAGSGLEQWIDVDPLMRKKILRYLVECALTNGTSVTLTYRGASETFHGVAGLGPSLQQGLMNDVDQQRVSACMLARVNGMGATVQIDMFGPMGPDVTGFQTETSADGAFSVQEGAFFGNLFAARPAAYACLTRPYALADTRTCKDLGGGAYSCGVVTFTADTCGAYNEQSVQCTAGFIAGSTRDFFTSCAGGELNWSYVLTTYVTPKVDGADCFADEECASGTCGGGVCVSALRSNGAQCSWSSECESGICDGGVCGLHAGTRCYASDQCASNNCSLKRKVCL